LARIFEEENKVLKRISKAQTLAHYKDAVKLNFEQEKLVFLGYIA
jgi:hypothetical protein